MQISRQFARLVHVEFLTEIDDFERFPILPPCGSDQITCLVDQELEEVFYGHHPWSFANEIKSRR